MALAGKPGIVGRDEPLRRVGEVIERSSAGDRAVMLVSGGAGIGKTSLIRAAIDAAASPETVVGWGTCWQGEGAPGFWPWMQALGDLVRAVGVDSAVTAAGRDVDTLGVLVRDLGRPSEEATGDLDQHRLLLLDAAVRWLEGLGRDHHLIVVLDDLQWADTSTFDLLDHVTAAPVQARLFVIGAYRHDELGGDARARLAALGMRADRVHLDGLTVDGVEQLISTIHASRTARLLAPELHRRTGGHPLFVSELARLPELGIGGALPAVVTGAVARRLELLPDESRSALDVAAVLGNRLLPDVLGAVIGSSPAEIVEALSPAIDAGIVASTAEEGFWFAHDLFRETVYGDLGASVRADIHGRVGDALEARRERGGSVAPGDLADHFVRAARTGDPGKAILWARRAATDERRRSAFAEAAGHLRRARTAAMDAGWALEPALLVELLMDEADSQARSGDPNVARALLAEAAGSATRPEEQADVALAVQRLGAKFAAPRSEIVEQLEGALVVVTGVDIARQAQLTAALARELQHSVAEDRLRAGSLSEQALGLGRKADDETLVACLLARHDALWVSGTGRERAEIGREIASVGVRLGDTDRIAEGLLLEANGMLESGAAGFRAVLHRWFSVLETRDEARDRYMVATRRAALALLDGDADGAEALMNRASEMGQEIHEPDTGNVLMSQRVALARARREPDEFRVLAADAVEWWRGAPALAHAVAAGAFAAAGDLEDARREVATVTALGGWKGEDSYLQSVLVAHLAEAAVALGDADLCRELLGGIESLTDSCGVNGAVVAFAGPFAHAAGILSAELGDLDGARTLLGDSVAIAQRLGAKVWVDHGRDALAALEEAPEVAGGDVATLLRSGNVWTVSWRDEAGSLTHAKGLADIAVLISHRGQSVSALQLTGGVGAASGIRDEMVDAKALDDYRRRLDELAGELDQADADADIGRSEALQAEHDQLLAEIRRVTGLAGRRRVAANDPAERARKAVSARIRDAIRRLEAVAPSLSAHLDRSIQTGLQCSYTPTGDAAAISWTLEGRPSS